MFIGLTGTPGTGKTSISKILSSRGHNVIHINDLIKEEGLYVDVDKDRDCLVADMDQVRKRVDELSACIGGSTSETRPERSISLKKDQANNFYSGDQGKLSHFQGIIILDSHISHHIADVVIVLRTAPDELRKRLSARAYSEEKIQENVEAECLDVILVEAVQWCRQVFEINTTERSALDVAEDVGEILDYLKDREAGSISEGDDPLDLKYRPGKYDWSCDIF